MLAILPLRSPNPGDRLSPSDKVEMAKVLNDVM